MTKSENPQPSQPLQPIYLWKWYISLKMTKSEHPQPSQPLQPIYFWKWYVSLKKWQSQNNRNPRNPRNLFIFENDIYLWKCKVWTSATLATLATYLSLKMIYIFKNDKVWISATLATLATCLFLKMICIFKKMTKSEHPQPSQPWNLFIFENDIYL